MLTSNSDYRWAVLVHYGTQAWWSIYGINLTEAGAELLRQTARTFGYHDALIVENYDPSQERRAA